MVRFAEERAAAALADLCGCPGLFAGQYEDLDLVPAEYVERRYDGAAGFMGLAKAYPTSAGLAALTECHGDPLRRVA
ncbi:hypothetical protein ABC347_07925 [Sphingomonas sp. 1P06PA]|uniref:hypothetical protein n=1 Tax=Sphingomonas sp. 1P06PA TaxID=554121 RepID=UPI0039A4EBE7